MTKYRVGGFTVLPLIVPHGNTECYSFVIDTPDGQRILFATDLSDFPYTIRDCTTIMLECNYISGMIVDKLMDNVDIRSQSQNHLELDACINVVRRLYSSKLMQVVLLHLSDGLSDTYEISRRFRNELGIDVHIACENMKITLRSEEF